METIRPSREEALQNNRYSSSITDELTGLYNRNYFHEQLEREMERAKRQGHPLSLIMLDVDGFKKFNDRYGHLKGDALLKTVKRVLRLSIRGHVDSAFRYGGDEFVVILPEADRNTALSVGNRIRTKFKHTTPFGLTLSVGVAEFQKDFDSETFVHLGERRPAKTKQESKENNQSRLCLANPGKRPASEKSGNGTRTAPKVSPQFTKDRRSGPRIKISKTFMHDGLQATVQNISKGGVQIKTKMSLPVGRILKIAFSLGDGIARFVGSVVYTKPLSDGYSLSGVRFTEVSKKDLLLLDRFLDSHLTQRAQNG
jgi:diguanylate cyclase (GGDEF)-like protein